MNHPVNFSSMSVYFLRPAQPEVPREMMLQQMRADIRTAKRRVAIVSAWFTDSDISRALIESPVPRCCKHVVLNRSDLNRERKSKAYPMLKSYFTSNPISEELRCEHFGESVPWLKDMSTNEYEALKRRAGHHPRCEGGISILGSNDWIEGVMHHKMILADDIVWTGSFNLTFAARNNYETLLRFVDPDVAETFWDELENLASEDPLWTGDGSQFNHFDGRFRCCTCLKLKRRDQEWEKQGHSTNIICQECGVEEERRLVSRPYRRG